MRQTYSTLNALRGMAATAVVVFHASPLWGRPILENGYLAVDLFFALSGFVIAHAYDAKIATLGLRDFMLTRAIRFFPLYALGLTLGFIAVIAELIVSPPASHTLTEAAGIYTTNLLFLPAPFFGDNDLYPLNVPAWTLGFELAVNIAFAVFHRHLTIKSLAVVAAISGAMLISVTLDQGNASVGATTSTALGGMARTTFGFSIGIILYRSGIRLAAPPYLPIAILLAIFLAPVPSSFRVYFDIASIMVIFPAIVALGANVYGGKAVETFEWLGRASYGVYSVHYPLIWLTAGAAGYFSVSTVGCGLGLLAALLVASTPLHYRFDEPARDWLKTKLIPHQDGKQRREPIT